MLGALFAVSQLVGNPIGDINRNTAKPTPSLPPLRDEMAVLMPTTSPSRLTSGPPLFFRDCNRSIRLQKVLAFRDTDPAMLRGSDNARCDCALQSKWLAECQDPSHQLRVRRCFRSSLQSDDSHRSSQRLYGFWVSVDVRCLEFATVVQSYCHVAISGDRVHSLVRIIARRIDHDT